MLQRSRNNRHFSAEDLARYAEGDLRVRKTARISAHLNICLRCQGVSADLTAVSETLASVPVPPMPVYLSVRIETALAAESAARVASQPAAGEASRRDLPVRSGRAGRRGLRMPGAHSPLGLRLTAGAAAAIIAAGVSYELVDHLGGTTGPAATASRPEAQPNLNIEYGPSVSYHHHGVLGLVQPIHTSTDFQPAQLTSQVHQALGESKERAPEVGRGTSSPEFHSATGTTAAPKATANEPSVGAPASPRDLSSCVSSLSSGNLVILVDVASFRGRAAIIIVTAGSNTARAGVVWIVGLGCSASDHHLLTSRHIDL
jgi:hypothetical protein